MDYHHLSLLRQSTTSPKMRSLPILRAMAYHFWSAKTWMCCRGMPSRGLCRDGHCNILSLLDIGGLYFILPTLFFKFLYLCRHALLPLKVKSTVIYSFKFWAQNCNLAMSRYLKSTPHFLIISCFYTLGFSRANRRNHRLCAVSLVTFCRFTSLEQILPFSHFCSFLLYFRCIHPPRNSPFHHRTNTLSHFI